MGIGRRMFLLILSRIVLYFLYYISYTISVVLTVSRVCEVVSVAVGTVGVRPFTGASYRIKGLLLSPRRTSLRITGERKFEYK